MVSSRESDSGRRARVPRVDYIPGNRVVLVQYGRPPRDYRSPPGGPVRVGDRVTVSVRTVPTVLVCYEWEYVHVAVSEELPGGRFAGVVACRLMPEAFNPDVFAEGSRLVFEAGHVHVIGEQP